MKILILTHLDAETIAQLQAEHDVSIVVGATSHNLSPYLATCEVMIYRTHIALSADLLAQAPQLIQIIRLDVDESDVDFDYLKEHNIEFVRIPRPVGRSVAELAFGLMIGLTRKIRCMDRRVRRGQPLPSKARGTTLEGKTLGIVGAGHMGRITGELGHLWGMKAIGCVKHSTEDKALRAREHGIRLSTFDDVLRSADFLVIQVPFDTQTHHLISTAELALMKPNAFLINMTPGGVVDERALHQALVAKQIAGAALDGHEASYLLQRSPLATLKNVILTPQIGALTVDAQQTVGKQVLRCIHELQDVKIAA